MLTPQHTQAALRWHHDILTPRADTPPHNSSAPLTPPRPTSVDSAYKDCEWADLVPYALVPWLAQLPRRSEESQPPAALKRPSAAPSLGPPGPRIPAPPPPCNITQLVLSDAGLPPDVRAEAERTRCSKQVADLAQTWLPLVARKGINTDWLLGELSRAVWEGNVSQLADGLARLGRLPLYSAAGQAAFISSDPYFALRDVPGRKGGDEIWLRTAELANMVATRGGLELIWVVLLHWTDFKAIDLRAEDLLRLAARSDGRANLLAVAQMRAHLDALGFAPLQLRALLYCCDAVQKITLACRCSALFLERTVTPQTFTDLCCDKNVVFGELEYRYVEQRGRRIFTRFENRHQTLCAAPESSL